jgi:hypothetical protein
MIEAMPVINNADFRALEAGIISPPSEQRWEIPANRLKEFGIDDAQPPPPTPPRITPGILNLLNFYSTICGGWFHIPGAGRLSLGDVVHNQDGTFVITAEEYDIGWFYATKIGGRRGGIEFIQRRGGGA